MELFVTRSLELEDSTRVGRDRPHPVSLPEERHARSVRSSETVLLVEDDEALRGLLSETLEGNGYTVLAARNGAEALLVADAHAGTIHLIVTDLIMPGMTGHHPAEEIASTRPEAKVLYISGYSNEAVTSRGGLSRGSAFPGRPFTPEGLLGKARELLDSPKV